MEELRPGRSRPPQRGVDSGSVRIFQTVEAPILKSRLASRSGSPVPPCWILSGQAHDRGAHATGDGGSPGSARFVVQRRAIVGGASAGWCRGDEQPKRSAGRSSRVRAASSAQSSSSHPRARRRRLSTASWWRRTRISISLLVSDRVCNTIQPRSLETSGRSIPSPSADNAWLPATDERAGHGLCAQFRAPAGGHPPCDWTNRLPVHLAQIAALPSPTAGNAAAPARSNAAGTTATGQETRRAASTRHRRRPRQHPPTRSPPAA